MDAIIDNNHALPQRSLGQDLLRVALATAAILLILLVAMRFTEEVNWTAFDFVVAAVLLGLTGTAYVFFARMTRQRKWRLAVGAILFLALLLVWAELAVGIFGSRFAGS
jgi:hypothetical protein